MSLRLARRAAWLAALALAAAGPSHAASLWGLKNPGIPADTKYQTLATEFRWELMGGNNLTVQYDDSYFNAFGAKGIELGNFALDTWQNGSMAGRNGVLPPAPTRYDLESVLVHEIGHVLGLTHPDTAPFGLDYSYDPAFNWVQLAPAGTVGYVAGANQVMVHDLDVGVSQRDLTGDDLAGMRFLYDPNNVNGAVAGAAVSFVGRGVDNPPGVDLAKIGTLLGRNVDIFALDFTGGIPATDCEGGSDEADCGELYFGKDGSTLALTRVRFKNTTPGTDGPGTILGADIFINTNVPFFVPEPATGLLVAAGLAVLSAGARSKKRAT